MKKESTAIRLKQIMKERNLRQTDILQKCKPFCEKFHVKLGRNDLSQYVNGKVEPGQEKLTILGLALNVNEAWLMGFDVPMERSDKKNSISESLRIMTFYNRLNTYGKEIATEQVRLLTLDEKYTKADNILSIKQEIKNPLPTAAHADDYIHAPDDLKQLEEDIMDDENF